MVKVDQVAIHPNGTEIAFSGIDYTDFADYRYGLYRYNLAEDKTRCVFEPGKYHIAQMVYLNDHKLMFVAGKHEKEAAMQCPEFMLVDLATDGVTLLCNQDLSVVHRLGLPLWLGPIPVRRRGKDLLYFRHRGRLLHLKLRQAGHPSNRCGKRRLHRHVRH